MTFDPYAELGIDRSASQEDVKRAHRKRAKKTHPDAGGTAAAFEKTQRAVMVLGDPKKRRTFDETGRIDEDEPEDTTRSAALQIIQAFIAEALDAYIKNGMAAQYDPRRRPLFEEFREKIRNEMFQIELSSLTGRKVLAFTKDMRTRFKGDDPAQAIDHAFAQRIAAIEDSLEMAKTMISARTMALSIADTYTIKMDDPPPAPTPGGYLGITVSVI